MMRGTERGTELNDCVTPNSGSSWSASVYDQRDRERDKAQWPHHTINSPNIGSYNYNDLLASVRRETQRQTDRGGRRVIIISVHRSRPRLNYSFTVFLCVWRLALILYNNPGVVDWAQRISKLKLYVAINRLNRHWFKGAGGGHAFVRNSTFHRGI